jgi:hypothetical protein
MPSIQEALSEAISKSNAGTLDTPVETPIETEAPVIEAASEPETAAEREQRLRDEKGRFAKGEKPEVAPKLEAQALPTPEAQNVRKPPSSWKKDYWDQWGRMDPKVQEYIEQREADYAKGVSTYKGQWDQAAPLMEAIQPFVPELQQYGIQPAQWIQNLGNAHRTLAMGSPEQKLQMFAKLATEYGIPLQALTGQGQADPQFGHVMQTMTSLQREVENFKQEKAATQNALLQQQIESFKKNAPHFEAVKDHMAQLLQSGMASDLPSAYDKAIRLHDDIWTQHQAQQAKDAEAARQAEIAKKKAAAVSPRSSGPTGQVATGSGKKDLRAVLSEAVSQHAGGRF